MSLIVPQSQTWANIPENAVCFIHNQIPLPQPRFALRAPWSRLLSSRRSWLKTTIPDLGLAFIWLRSLTMIFFCSNHRVPMRWLRESKMMAVSFGWWCLFAISTAARNIIGHHYLTYIQRNFSNYFLQNHPMQRSLDEQVSDFGQAMTNLSLLTLI
jgi:hypothetical protein